MISEIAQLIRMEFPNVGGNSICLNCGEEYAQNHCSVCKNNESAINSAIMLDPVGKRILNYVSDYRTEHGVKLTTHQMVRKIKHEKFLHILTV